MLLLLMAVATGQSVFLLLQQSLRLDEAQSLWQSSHGLGRMYELIAQDVHVPLYHTILHLWTTVLGDSVPVARAMSMLFFVLTIPAVYALARRVLDVPNALFGAALVALSPFMNWYGNEIRMYTLLTLLVVLNQLFFLRIYQRAGGANWAGYLVTALAGVYTHYFFWAGLLTQAVFYVVARRSFPAGTFRRLAGSAVLLAVALAPWQLFVFRQGGNGGTRPLLAAPTSADLFNTFAQFVVGFQDERLNTLLVALWPLAVLLALFALQKSRRSTPEVGFFLLAGLLPILATFVYSLVGRPLYLSRYLIIALPALLIFLSWLFTVYGGQAARLLRTATVVGMVAMSLHQAVSATTPVKEDYQAASQFLAASAAPQDVVIISPPFTSYPLQYYYDGNAAVQTLPVWNRFKEGAAPAFDAATLPKQAKTLAANHVNAWLVLSYDQGYQRTIREYYDKNYQRLSMKEVSPGLTVYKYRLRYNIPDTAALIDSLNR